MALLARHVMHTQLVTVEPTLPAVELVRLLDREHISGAPVVEGRRLVGVVSRADLAHPLADADDRAEATLDYYREVSGASADWSERARLIGARTGHLRVSDLMSEALVTVPATSPLRDVARVLVQHGIHRVLRSGGAAPPRHHQCVRSREPVRGLPVSFRPFACPA